MSTTRASPWILPLVCAVLAGLMVASIAIGDFPLSPVRLWAGLTNEDALAATVIYQIRLPRVIVAALVGAALSGGGLVMQAYFRNGLASPYCSA